MQFTTTFIAAALPFLASAAKDGRTFAVNRFYGDGPLVTARMDPIISPGQTSGHVHMVMGGNGFKTSMNDSSALDSTCTNSLIANDGSNYWVPSLWFQATNGSFISVPMFYMNVYYFFEATDDDIKAFPTGLRMVSGNPFLRTPPPTNGTLNIDSGNGPINAVQFTCPRSTASEALGPLYPTNSDGLHGVGIQDPGNAGAGVGFPDMYCDGYASPLRMDVHFPSCYNPAAGLSNYASNTAFPSSKNATKAGRMNCPEGWIHTPHLFYEVYWNTPLFNALWTQGQGKQPFVLAQGDPTGYGLHGDFFAGWDENTIQTIIDTCDAGDSGMDKCPQIPGGLSQTKTSCHVTAPLTEAVSGVLGQLPGCNPIQAAGTTAVQETCSSTSNTSKRAEGHARRHMRHAMMHASE